MVKAGKILSIANQKGGVGKTTTAVNLAAALQSMGYKIMIMDLDPHANASVHLRYYPEELPHTVDDLFTETSNSWQHVWPRIRYTHPTQHFDVVPASIHLSELEADLRNKPGKGTILQRALGEVIHQYDYIILDCPPHVGILLVNALVAADLLIIPIQTDFLALHGLKLLFDTIRIINKVLPAPIRYKILPTLFDKRAKACTHVLTLLQNKMDENMFSTIIGIDTRFRDASAQGQVIYEIAPNSRGAKAYKELAKEITAL